FSHLPLLRCHAVSNARVECPESRQRVGQSCGRVLDLDAPLSSGKFPQRTWDVKDQRHIHLLVRRFLLFDLDFVCGEGAGAALGNVGPKPPEASSTTAFRTHTTDGSPSSIFCHVLPSSRSPKSCPLRVPKYSPTGSNESAVMASRRTVS